MKKTKKFLALFFIVILAVLFACPFMASKKSAIAYASGGDEVSPQGLYASVSLKLNVENQTVIATAKNDFTLFPSNIQVYIYLYSCYTYRDSYTEMVLVQQDYTSDLNMGKSITVSAITNGEQKYWQARMKYKVDKKDWIDTTTYTYLISGDGKLMEEIKPQ